MSWEVNCLDKNTCPCGEGVYVVEYRSDDQGRYEERGFIKCDQCKEKYKVERVYGTFEHAERA